MREGEDTVDVLRVDLASMTVERLGSHGADMERTARPAASAHSEGASVLGGTHSTVRFPVPGSDQETDFMNATLQSTADEGDSIVIEALRAAIRSNQNTKAYKALPAFMPPGRRGR